MISTEQGRAILDELASTSIAMKAVEKHEAGARAALLAELVDRLLKHRVALIDLAEEALAARHESAAERVDKRTSCCWEAMIACEVGCDPEVEVVRFDEFEDLDEIIPWGIGWGEIERITIRLVNDERAGRLPPIKSQLSTPRAQDER